MTIPPKSPLPFWCYLHPKRRPSGNGRIQVNVAQAVKLQIVVSRAKPPSGQGGSTATHHVGNDADEGKHMEM